jgi:hypothetical protein
MELEEKVKRTKQQSVYPQQTFLSTVGLLDGPERKVLKLLIMRHSAMAIRAIRNQLVFYELNNNPRSRAFLKALAEAAAANKAVYRAITPDDELIAKGVSPFTNLTKKAEIVEGILRENLNLSICTWSVIEKAVKTLFAEGFVSKREGAMTGQKSGRGTLYYVSPQTYSLWRAEWDVVRDRQKKDAEDKFWFAGFDEPAKAVPTPKEIAAEIEEAKGQQSRRLWA